MALHLRFILSELRLLTVVDPKFRLFEDRGPGIRYHSEDHLRMFMMKLLDLVYGPEDPRRRDKKDPAYDILEDFLRGYNLRTHSCLSPEYLAEDFQSLRKAIPESHRTPHFNKLRDELDLCAKWLKSLCVVNPSKLVFEGQDQERDASNKAGYCLLGTIHAAEAQTSTKQDDPLVKDRLAAHILEVEVTEGGVLNFEMTSAGVQRLRASLFSGNHGWLSLSRLMRNPGQEKKTGMAGLRSSQKLIANLYSAHSNCMDVESKSKENWDMDLVAEGLAPLAPKSALPALRQKFETEALSWKQFLPEKRVSSYISLLLEVLSDPRKLWEEGRPDDGDLVFVLKEGGILGRVDYSHDISDWFVKSYSEGVHTSDSAMIALPKHNSLSNRSRSALMMLPRLRAYLLSMPQDACLEGLPLKPLEGLEATHEVMQLDFMALLTEIEGRIGPSYFCKSFYRAILAGVLKDGEALADRGRLIDGDFVLLRQEFGIVAQVSDKSDDGSFKIKQLSDGTERMFRETEVAEVMIAMPEVHLPNRNQPLKPCLLPMLRASILSEPFDISAKDLPHTLQEVGKATQFDFKSLRKEAEEKMEMTFGDVDEARGTAKASIKHLLAELLQDVEGLASRSRSKLEEGSGKVFVRRQYGRCADVCGCADGLMEVKTWRQQMKFSEDELLEEVIPVPSIEFRRNGSKSQKTLETLPALRALALDEPLDLSSSGLPLKLLEGCKFKVMQWDFEALRKEAEEKMGTSFEDFDRLASLRLRCPQEHLAKVHVSGQDWYCDVCRKDISSELMLGCKRCNWDICQTCATKGS
eukprot:TRINITY_DN5402_c0_g1_i2.p1 TRINITY_DN5402_c0_g1~~TRINITY_DN5402_c0_g1_i2.p1  ORF type:complete len:814 (-),score=153.34 TRINITY_DN5402_c0_g1_i2:142-2562(-)